MTARAGPFAISERVQLLQTAYDNELAVAVGFNRRDRGLTYLLFLFFLLLLYILVLYSAL